MIVEIIAKELARKFNEGYSMCWEDYVDKGEECNIEYSVYGSWKSFVKDAKSLLEKIEVELPSVL